MVKKKGLLEAVPMPLYPVGTITERHPVSLFVLSHNAISSGVVSKPTIAVVAFAKDIYAAFVAGCVA